jgi:hypothetical protein
MLDNHPNFPTHLLDPITDDSNNDSTVAPPTYADTASTPAKPFASRYALASLDAFADLLNTHTDVQSTPLPATKTSKSIVTLDDANPFKLLDNPFITPPSSKPLLAPTNPLPPATVLFLSINESNPKAKSPQVHQMLNLGSPKQAPIQTYQIWCRQFHPQIQQHIQALSPGCFHPCSTLQNSTHSAPGALPKAPIRSTTKHPNSAPPNLQSLNHNTRPTNPRTN